LAKGIIVIEGIEGRNSRKKFDPFTCGPVKQSSRFPQRRVGTAHIDYGTSLAICLIGVGATRLSSFE
jgi:hypothetical protein